MRMSCNGCRVLRKGCGDTCAIRPCLHWIPTPDSQANATLFLAKFYGRAGLINLINAGPDLLRPAIFRSLLYEACGRIVNPVYGAPGLLLSGSWHLCHAAVEAVLAGSPLPRSSSDSVAPPPHLRRCDIRHVFRDGAGSPRRPRPRPGPGHDRAPAAAGGFPRLHDRGMANPGPCPAAESDSVSGETVEASMIKEDDPTDGSDLELELTLGFEPRRVGRLIDGSGCATCKLEMTFDPPA